MLGFLLRYEDDERYPVIHDCDDWDEILPTLISLEKMLDSSVSVVDHERMVVWKDAMRVLFEALYVAGYRRGLSESKELF